VEALFERLVVRKIIVLYVFLLFSVSGARAATCNRILNPEPFVKVTAGDLTGTILPNQKKILIDIKGKTREEPFDFDSKLFESLIQDSASGGGLKPFLRSMRPSGADITISAGGSGLPEFSIFEVKGVVGSIARTKAAIELLIITNERLGFIIYKNDTAFKTLTSDKDFLLRRFVEQ
jgi:hypothetical protein